MKVLLKERMQQSILPFSLKASLFVIFQVSFSFLSLLPKILMSFAGSSVSPVTKTLWCLRNRVRYITQKDSFQISICIIFIKNKMYSFLIGFYFLFCMEKIVSDRRNLPLILSFKLSSRFLRCSNQSMLCSR